MVLIPGKIVSALTFPGIILHEIGHLAFCELAGVRVHTHKLIDQNLEGHVVHEKPKSVYKQFLVTFGPFFFNTLATAAFTLLATSTGPLAGIFLWLAISSGMHAFPSLQDGKVLLEHTENEINSGKYLASLLLLPISLIYLGALLSIFWADLFYALVVIALTSAMANAPITMHTDTTANTTDSFLNNLSFIPADPIRIAAYALWPSTVEFRDASFVLTYPSYLIRNDDLLKGLAKPENGRRNLLYLQDFSYYRNENDVLIYTQPDDENNVADTIKLYREYLNESSRGKTFVDLYAKIFDATIVGIIENDEQGWYLEEFRNESKPITRAVTACNGKYVVILTVAELNTSSSSKAVKQIIDSFRCLNEESKAQTASKTKFSALTGSLSGPDFTLNYSALFVRENHTLAELNSRDVRGRYLLHLYERSNYRNSSVIVKMSIDGPEYLSEKEYVRNYRTEWNGTGPEKALFEKYDALNDSYMRATRSWHYGPSWYFAEAAQDPNVRIAVVTCNKRYVSIAYYSATGIDVVDEDVQEMTKTFRCLN